VQDERLLSQLLLKVKAAAEKVRAWGCGQPFQLPMMQEMTVRVHAPTGEP
jgi:hypothetical protein